MRRPPLLPSLLSLLSILALAAPAVAPAAEAGVTTTVAPPGETTVGPPAEETPTAPAEAPAPTTTTEAETEAEAVAPQVESQQPQGASPSGSSKTSKKSKNPSGEGSSEEEEGAAAGARAKRRAASPSTLTPALPLNLRAGIGAVPSFFIESFQVPPFLLPIFQAAGTAYGIPWQVLAAINEVETDYGRDLGVSSAGAEGWMQFLPASWAQYGVDANGDGYRDPYNPADAIFSAARYLRAAGGEKSIKAAVFSYNHSQAYVQSVMLRAQLLSGTPSELLGAITGLTESRFPVHAAARFSDGFPTAPASGSGAAKTLVGTTIYSQAGAPVIAVQDGEVVQIGDSPSLGRFVSLRDAYGNTYTYAQLGDVASVYPVLEPREQSTVSSRISHAAGQSEPAPSGPATAGAQARSPISEAAVISGLALGATASLETIPPVPASSAPAPVQPSAPVKPATPDVHAFREGSNVVFLNPLHAGVQVIAGTVLGHVGAPASGASESSPHILFQVRPAGIGAPLIDPKPILDGWVALENTAIFRAKGENPFLATSPTVGQVLLESKQQLQPQVLHDAGIRFSRCGRETVQAGRVDRRVLALLEYLSVLGLKPTVSGLKCSSSSAAASASYAPASEGSEIVNIEAVNGVPVAGHQSPGSLADNAVRKLLMLQGLNRPQRILSLMNYPGAAGALVSPSARRAIRITFAPRAAGGAHAASLSYAGLAPSDWIKLIARLGEIPDPVVAHEPSSAALPAAPSGERQAGGDR
ncbi:MAG TPA: lytic murein transglycosylase [Solirubrobacteraceae bacterium]|nr:lytic murein transglycosylase [Solirubrobacteraceae bacterium]